MKKKNNSMDEYFMKSPCKHCPFRNDIEPFITASRGEQLAYHAQNKYNSFTCHKTTVHDDETEDGKMLNTEDSKECAGFLTLQIAEEGDVPDGFTPSYEIVYTDSFEMSQAYSEEFRDKPINTKKQ